ncbi:MAG: glycoside hydrolase family 53 protein [Bacteroidales bacterium]
MKKLICLVLVTLLIFVGCKKEIPAEPEEPTIKQIYRGADISFLPEIQESGIQFYNQLGIASSMVDILKQSGVNTVRLRLWHTPADGHSGLKEVSDFTKTLKAKGFKIFITIHYSDTWADPGNQTKPAAWENLSFGVLGDSVYNYTKHVVEILNPDIIEIGNEISNGFLWPEGKISNETNFVSLLKKGIAGARAASIDKRKILIHSAKLDVSNWFYEIMQKNGVDYDIIGVSYYPFWTKIKPQQAVDELMAISNTFGKDAMFAETSYPFTLNWNDYTNNVIGLEEQLLPGYPATPEGQKLILTELRQAMDKTGKGVGFCYWAPEWVAFKGNQSATGSSWENMALFDFDNKALPAWDAFKE